MNSENTQQKRFRILYKLEAWLEGPMFLLSIVWLYLFIVELTGGLSPVQEKLVVLIWILFVLEFSIKLVLSASKVDYMKRNWLTIVALFIPAFRAFRLLRAVRVLQLSRVATTTTFVRGLTSSRRFLNELKDAQGETPAAEIHVGVLLAYSPAVTPEGMQPFLKQLTLDVQPEMNSATEIPWTFHLVEPVALTTDKTREPSDFLDAATMRMTEGPYDIVLVITDVTLISRRDRIEAGLASPVTYTAVVSTQRLTTTSRGKPVRTLDAAAVRHNTAALLLHLLGHISGLHHTKEGKGGVMAPFSFREGRKLPPRFTEKERALLKEQVKHLPERELRGGTGLESLIFHLIMAAKHPKAILSPLLRNWAILLPLSLPGLATAAVAPSLLLIFTAEIWDVGLNMGNRTTAFFAVVSILGASFYLIKIQSLFLPRKEKNVLTEHQAIANVVIFLSILLACFGLFLMVGGLMMVIELYVFPEDLISTWPTLDKPVVGLSDKLRLAAFISTVGVTTGALAGGLEKKTVIQHLALFLDKP
ncbi:hypothetical protein ACFSRY_18960 [Pontibacter locisalis]|uniref:Uncharacterized protein n=1 Tax=Pontibacter locisalis TaxID=1719035 RepID=A0ABW5IV49_9BACT